MPRRLRPVGHDEQLSLVDHLDELRTRIIWSLLAFAVAFGVCYWQNGAVLATVNRPVERALDKNPGVRSTADFNTRLGQLARSLGPALGAAERSATSAADRRALADAIRAARAAASSVPPNRGRRPITFGVTEPFLTTFKVAGYAAIVLVLPFLLYQLYAFVLPAFNPRERGAILPLLVMVPALFVAGVLFAYFIALPRAASFLLNFNASHFDIQLRAQDYYSFAITFLGGIGLLFQVPIAVLALARLEIVSVAQMRKNRGYVILASSIIAAVVTPTPDPVTMLITMAPMVVLFELSILMAAVLERRRERQALLADDLDVTLT